MMGGMYAAISGLSANQTMLNDTANDLANVNTVGYKSSRVTFADSLTQVLRGASASTATNGGTNPLQIGLGVQVNSTDNQMSEGSFQSTNNPLDVAIEGTGFLRVGSGTPPATAPFTSGLPANMQYTRAGNLTTNTLGFLTTQAGQYVIGRNAVATTTAAGTTYTPGAEDTYIQIPPGSANVSIGQDGSVTYRTRTPRRRPTSSRSRRATCRWRSSPTRPAWSGSAARPGRRRPTPAPRSSARPTPAPTVRRSAASWRCRTSISPPR